MDKDSIGYGEVSNREPALAALSEGRGKKPLGRKAYGSIGHLPNSRTGPGDWHVHEGQAKICVEKPRKGDRVIVTEKLDGACMSVAKMDGALIPLTRSGWRPEQTTFLHLQQFAPWVAAKAHMFNGLLANGERVVGEWLTMAHGTRYDSDHYAFHPFIAFDIFRNDKRVLRDEFAARCKQLDMPTAHLIHDGGAISVEEAILRLGEYGAHGSIDPVEGCVWRVEREGRVDFLAKYVRHDKIDGKYFEQITGQGPVWNFFPLPLPSHQGGNGND